MENAEQAQVLEKELRQMEQVHVLETALRQTFRTPTSEMVQKLVTNLLAGLADRLLAKLNEMGYEIRKKTPARKATTAAKKAAG